MATRGRKPNTPTPDSVTNAPMVDLSNLATAVVEDDLSTPGSTKWKDNPFVALLRDSYLSDDAGENGVRGIPGVQANQVKRQIVPALRNAAEQLANEDIGIRIKFMYKNDAGEIVETGNMAQFIKDTHEDEREVRVKFLGRPRKVYLSDEQKAEAVKHGLVLKDRDGKPFDPPRIDTSAYLQWVSAREADDEDEDNGGDVVASDDE